MPVLPGGSDDEIVNETSSLIQLPTDSETDMEAINPIVSDVGPATQNGHVNLCIKISLSTFLICVAALFYYINVFKPIPL